MPFINPLRRLAPNGYAVPPPITDYPDQEANSPLGNQPPQRSPLVSLAGSQDATGSDGYDTPILRQYSRLLANPPQQQPVSGGRRVLGALAALGAGASPADSHNGQPTGFRYDPKAAEIAQSNIVDAPFNQQVKNYDLQAKVLGEGANVEEKKVSNQRLADTAKQAQLDREDANKVRQQNADTAAKKENDIREQKINELQAKSDKAANDLAEKQKEFEGKQTNFEQQLELHKLQMSVADAQHRLVATQKDNALAESIRMHDMEKANWDQQRKDAEARIKALEEATKAKAQPTQTNTSTESKTEGGFTIPGTNFHLGGHTIKTTTTNKGPAASQSVRKEIPGNPGKFAISTDGGKTWKAE